MDIGGWLWLVVDVLLVAVLAGGMIYGTMQWRRRSSPEMKRVSEEAVRRNYREGG